MEAAAARVAGGAEDNCPRYNARLAADWFCLIAAANTCRDRKRHHTLFQREKAAAWSCKDAPGMLREKRI